MNTAKAVTAAIAGVTSGVLFVTSAGTIHGTALVLTQAALAALNTIGATYGVYQVRNASNPPGVPVSSGGTTQ